MDDVTPAQSWTPRFAERVQGLQASGIRKLFERGLRQPDVVDLSIGQADFPVPDAVKDATVAAINGDCGRYSTTEGFPELIDATLAHLRTNFHLPADEQVMMTVGASGALTLALLTLAGPGDEVLIPDPHFVIFPNLARIVGATPVSYDLYPDFKLRPERIEAAITPRTRVLILNSPSNPTGACATEDQLHQIAAICRRHNITVISDELYDVFVYEGQHASIKKHLGPEALLIGGVSKSFAMAGWRLGWIAGAPALIDRIRTLQQFTMTCPPTLVQMGVLPAFDLDMTPQVDAYRRKRNLVHSRLTAMGYSATLPQGAFYIFPRVPWGTDLTFSEAALTEGLLIVPGSAFSSRSTHFRLCFAPPEHELERGLNILETLINREQTAP
ncbi:MAG: aminotransferase class I/II-fold pyridoxal phosphate-dependent enzyme [Planctomycetota bacterium]|jgi:aspartate aminotransferase/aminotransferase|nr:aminotransferase class I/II-fold pyridoxal phosphate-dependent enzyme [Planctomycetota bacterium]